MANLLQEQMLKAGLIKPDQLKKAAKEKRRDQRPNAAESAAEKAQREKVARDRARNLERKAAQERKAKAAEIRQLILAHKLDRSKADIPYQFLDGGKIRKLYLEQGQREQLMEGRLILVRMGERFEVVPPPIAEKIAQRDPARVVALDTAPPESPPPADDPYADYPVPDDLMW
ncbi:MAG: DUF2058 domain-containing protein [Pseudomonadota bacterium]|nr:DUF2058 domain-containing protein [Pseudomonadota bacterium]